ncbi:hypothetical protein OG851_27115 [Streptomyces sp. NBC_00161]|uniref:hypothetical protein n=1 Tax=Streptomyces sp. NBC_00161 TaxID=2975671 RepID=UPI00324DFF38
MKHPWCGRKQGEQPKNVPSSTDSPPVADEPAAAAKPVSELLATEAKPDDEQGPWWGDETVPQNYGATESAITMGNVASPFLAGFSLAAYIQTISLATSAVRWRGPSMVLFLSAASLLIFAVQTTFLARRHLVTPKDLMDWWPDWAQPYRRNLLSGMLKEDNKSYRQWTNVARLLFGLGLLCLLAGLTLLAVPPDSPCPPLTRWLTVCVGTLATLAEAIWLGWEIKHWLEKAETLGSEVRDAELS